MFNLSEGIQERNRTFKYVFEKFLQKQEPLGIEYESAIFENIEELYED